ncbi:MAG TPA: serine/threonine-protein kinase [Kofleriaceae bacterium]|nr:serine/threonine-protein kinase [Kofleriaceae bacterium]
MVAQTMGADALAPGLRLGRYELIRRIAVGGMAEIYLARATGIEGFEKLVVLKRILPQFARNGEFVAMFLDEARLSATLQHPNIAQVHDIGQYGDSYFFTMEYIRGEDVRSILKAAIGARKRVPLANALTIITGAAAGLHAAHEKRAIDGTPLEIVHRDVSPSNVLVSYDGAVKLVDFGVAKAAQRQTETAAGTLKGKVSYMSPEQCRGKHVDRRSDVFALGILLYELTLHRRLFKGDSEYEIMTKIVNEDVGPPSAIMSRYPAALEHILLRSLRREPDERYRSAQDMQLELEEFARSHGLALSAIGLGAYMQEMFIDHMRAEEAAVRRRPRTGEIVPADVAATATSGRAGLLDEDYVEIDVDVAGADDADLEIEIEMPATRIGSSSGSRADGELADQVPVLTSRAGRWVGAVAGIAVLGIAGLLITAVLQSSGDGEPATGSTEVSRAAVAPAVSAPRAAPSEAQAAPAVTEAAPPEAASEPAEAEPAAESQPVVERELAVESSAAVAAEDSDREPAATRRQRPRRQPARVKASAARAGAGKTAAASSSPARSSVAAPAASWSLDSPLPPPKRK